MSRSFFVSWPAHRIYSAVFLMSLCLVVVLGAGVRFMRVDTFSDRSLSLQNTSNNNVRPGTPVLELQFKEDIQKALESLQSNERILDWYQAGYRPEDIFSAAFALKTQRKEAQTALCGALADLPLKDLAVFSFSISTTASLPCKKALMGKLNKFWEEGAKTLGLTPTPLSKPSSKLISRVQSAAELESAQWILSFEGRLEPSILPELLATLKAHGAKAVFFIAGESAEAYSSLIEKISKEGHLLGTVGFSYEPLALMSVRNAERDIERSRSALAVASGTSVPFFRFPYESTSEFFESFVQQKGLEIFPFTMDSEDWKTPEASPLFERVRGRMLRENHGVLRLSLHLKQTSLLLQALLPWMEAQGQTLALPLSPAVR